MITKSTVILSISCSFILAVLALTVTTYIDIQPVEQSFGNIMSDAGGQQILDRHGDPLNISYQSKWNINQNAKLHEIPQLLKTTFIYSEDKRFYEHGGVDWAARASAVYLNLKHMRALRGASTITEQVVRMINERPRTAWSRWIEGFEAVGLEKHFEKDDILEFYLNQVPYAANRRGVVQAARYYFDRDLDTLSKKEMLALVVLVRAPSAMDMYSSKKTNLESSINELSYRLAEIGILTEREAEVISKEQFVLKKPTLPVSAPHFVRFVKMNEYSGTSDANIHTTLNSSLQAKVQLLVDKHLENNKDKKVVNAAVLITDHTTSEILAWVVGGNQDQSKPGSFIDAVTTPRQPGSALKPFLYALALDKDWSPATMIDDSPLFESVGHGIHSYQNYSHTFYGLVTLRQALANSLNIPALKTLQYVGAENYFEVLSALGFSELTGHPNFYGDGISLGNGEVSLYNLVQAYNVLANKGMFVPLKVFTEFENDSTLRRVFSEEATSLIGDILSDGLARTMEFSENSVLNIPVQTAVKTGTSSDFRDAWSVGFNYRYTLGVWMGNLDQTPTDGLTGSTGPALLLRSIFSELTKNKQTKPLYLSPKLQRLDYCINGDELNIGDDGCIAHTEWFIDGTLTVDNKEKKRDNPIRIRVPSNNLHIAYDPRLPEQSQQAEFLIDGVEDTDIVHWVIDRENAASIGSRYLWQIEKGEHSLFAEVVRDGVLIERTNQISFIVK